MANSELGPEPPHDYFVVILSGTHVTGKEALAISLAEALHTSWIKADMVHAAAGVGASSQSKKAYSYDEVFDRIWFAKLLRLGFLSGRGESDGESDTKPVATSPLPRKTQGAEAPAAALMTCFAMAPHVRDAMRKSMWAHRVKPIFVIMQITKEVLSGRTLGAETPELAENIMKNKIADLTDPLEDETDVIIVDSTQEVDVLFHEIQRRVCEKLGVDELP